MRTAARAVLLDIEGTTGSIAFVHEILFPYARARLEAYVADHPAETAPVLAAVSALEGTALAPAAAVERLLAWMDEDRKATPLKTLQGMIWRDGYEGGALKGHVYADAERSMRAWRAAGIEIYIYSSGSVDAQTLLFRHSVFGDLTPLLSGYFDTAAGPKQEPSSYLAIAAEIGVAAGEILFLSDHPGEVAAARAAGMGALRIDREGGAGLSSFDEVHVKGLAA